MKLTKVLAASVASTFIVGAASAATVICEGGGPGLGAPFAPSACDVDAGDFGPLGSGRVPTVELDTIDGPLHVFGSIRDKRGRNGKFQDAWVFDYGAHKYNVTFKWADVERRRSNPFDGELRVGGDAYAVTADEAGDRGEFTLWNRHGMETFVLDAAAPDGRKVENLRWKVEVSAVPLPAAGWLLLAGVGGLAAMKRKKRNA